MDRMVMKRGCTGRTLLEVVLTLSLFALCSAVSAPRLSAMSSRLKLREVSLKLGRLVGQLPILARQRGTDLLLRTSGQSVIISARAENSVKIRQINVGEQAAIHINSATRKLFAYPSGTVSPARIVVSDGVFRCVLIVALHGRTRTEC